MAKKKRNNSPKSAANANASPKAPVAAPSATDVPAAGIAAKIAKPLARLGLPAELGKGDWTAIILSLMLFITPAVGVPREEMLQDTLKSIIVSFMVLGALLLVFWNQRNRRDPFRWHALMWLPIALMLYALGSMVWTKTYGGLYLAGVEAIRWFIFSILLWLTLNSIGRDKLEGMAWGIHVGAFCVALLGTSQFWFNVTFIPQGPNPAASFVNRNFAAEFMACTLAYSVFLLARSKGMARSVFLSFSLSFNLLFMLMCGTRSAMIGGTFALVSFLVAMWLYRDKFAFGKWPSGQRIMVAGVFIATVGVLGLIKSGNPAGELKDLNAWQRGLDRAQTIAHGTNDNSFNVRLVMWKTTLNMIEKRPFSGVGAGAWEVDEPLYQAKGAQLETDYYVHNEILQLLAEYGIVGWLFLIALVAYLLQAAWRTFSNRTEEGRTEAPIRFLALSSLLGFLVISNAGFPWRLAATGALYAVGLGLLAASDARLGYRGWWATARLAWKPVFSQIAAVVTIFCLALAAYITNLAATCEQEIVDGVKLALQISQSGDYNNPKWDKNKAQMLTYLKEGTDINPHYRKITPMAADEMAKWGDWKDAIWVWESVVSSRPYVVAILSNIARGYAAINQPAKALEYLERCKKIQPDAPAVISLDVVIKSRSGKEAEATKEAKDAIAQGIYDYDLVSAAYVLGMRAGDWDFALKGLELRNKGWPEQAVDGWLKMGTIYSVYKHDDAKALDAFRQAVAAAPAQNKDAVKQQVPQALRDKL